MIPNLFFAGVPATGKSWLGQWLAEERGYLHIDAEKGNGKHFTDLNLERQWDDLFNTGSASNFVEAVNLLGKPVIVNWGFPTDFLFAVSELQEKGFQA
jgi:hypothetical protein